ncbi:MAG: ABC transporter permease subunit [Actinobacteria bacterium]|nr:ABC transporter permease subunit [Actinomycetota bacterium]
MGALWDWFTDPANWQGNNGIPVRFAQQMAITLIAMAVAMAIALPLGVYLGHKGKGGFLAINVGNVGRAIPTFGLLMIFAAWAPIGVGNLAAIIALIIFAIPPLLTNAYIGVRDVDEEVRSAARGMGFSGLLMLRKVELPNAVPFIAAGIRTSTVQVVATASLAALVGGGGLGVYVVEGFAIQDDTLLIAGAILTAVLAIGVDLVLALIQRRVTP